MRNWASKRLAGGAAVALALAALAIPAIGQEQAPESLLPPGFGDPPPAATPTTDPNAPAQPPMAPGGEIVQPLPSGAELPASEADEDDEETDEEEEIAELDPFDLPEAARRNPDMVGVLTEATGGIGADQWGDVSGRFASALMRDIDAPVASRWASILLRRVLLTEAPTPGGVAGADWVAERAWLLLRMGEADPARLLVAGIDIDRFTPKLFDIAQQTALATADPVALCPLVDRLPAGTDPTSWDLARAMCAALSGDNGTASAIVDTARRRGKARGFDLLLAEKVVGVGGGRRAITLQWDGVGELTTWRFGLANAVNVPIPAPLFETVGPHVRAWQMRAPMIEPEARVGPASWAASLGVLSSAAYVDLIGAAFEAADPDDLEETIGFRLRSAYSAEDPPDRLDALREIWSQPRSDIEIYARLVLTARAAARVSPSEDRAEDARNLIAAMFTAGLDDAAARWGPVADELDDDSDAWALLAVGAPRPVVTISSGRAGDYVDQHDAPGDRKGAFLVAALAGLGRLPMDDVQSLATEHRLPLGLQNSWTRAIDRAAAKRQAGTVALLAAAGMQTRSWKAVHPAYLMHIVGALRRVGREPEARMIAAEAITRA